MCIILFQAVDLALIIKEGTPSAVVSQVALKTLGPGAWLVIVSIIILPITSGDTAFRSLRSIFAEIFNINQKKAITRILIALPFFIASYLIMQIGYNSIWAYFS